MTAIALIAFFLTLEPAMKSHEPTEAQTKFWIKHNREVSRLSLETSTERFVERPFAEYEKTQYLIMDAVTSFSTDDAKLTMIRNLPTDIELVFIDQGPNSYLPNRAKEILGENRVHVIPYHHGMGFWTRDALPIPTFARAQEAENFAVIDAEYFHNFNEDDKIATHFQAKLLRHSYGFEGGNFLSDTRGRCFMVNNSRHALIPDSIFERYYGCQTVVRMPHLSGIGHIDERLKLISDTLAVTDRVEYVNKLKELGFEVVVLPTSRGDFQSYANSILLNGVVFVPIYHQNTDDEALKVYRDLGLKVVPIDAESLSSGMGSIHCITMTYPPAPYKEIEDTLAPNR